MFQKKSVKLIVPTVLAFLAILALLTMRPGTSNNGADNAKEQEPFVSSIQPLSNVQASENDGVISGSFPSAATITSDQNQRLTRLFNEALNSASKEQAILVYEKIIKEFPSAIEPHINLSALYSEKGELDKARNTLLHGLEQNPKANMLFTSLQKIHGALAASAYSKAMNTSSWGVSKVNLPSISKLVTNFDQQQQIKALQAQIDSLASATKDQELNENAEKLSSLNQALEQSKQELEKQKSQYNKQILDLNSQLNNLSQSLVASQESEKEALARVVLIEQAANAQLDQATQTALELVQQENDQNIDLLTQKVNSLNSQVASLQAKLSIAEKAADAVAVAALNTNTEATKPVKTQSNSQIAVGLVKSWAKSWSAQDVNSYVSHYANNYTSSASLSRQQWLQQRQIRLTNKSFIRVNVSNFVVKDLGNQFSVTFYQKYASNTVDDTVRKRLIFNKVDGNWQQAKIVSESIVSR